MSNATSTLRSLGIAARLMLILTVVLGVLYPLFVTGVGQLTLVPGLTARWCATARGRWSDRR